MPRSFVSNAWVPQLPSLLRHGQLRALVSERFSLTRRESPLQLPRWCMGMSPKRIETLEAPEIELLENLLAAQADCEVASTPSEQRAARKRWMAASQRIKYFVLRGSALRSGRGRPSTR